MSIRLQQRYRVLIDTVNTTFLNMAEMTNFILSKINECSLEGILINVTEQGKLKIKEAELPIIIFTEDKRQYYHPPPLNVIHLYSRFYESVFEEYKKILLDVRLKIILAAIMTYPIAHEYYHWFETILYPELYILHRIQEERGAERFAFYTTGIPKAAMSFLSNLFEIVMW